MNNSPELRPLADLLADPLRDQYKPLPSDEELNLFIEEMCRAIGPYRSVHEIRILVIFLLRKTLRGLAESTTTRKELIQQAAFLMSDVEGHYADLLLDLLSERP